MNDTTRPSIGDVSQAVAVVTVALYAIGFTVTNAYLARWNAASFELASAQYLAAGLLFAGFLAIFWFVVVRRMLSYGNDVNRFKEALSHVSSKRGWQLFASLYVLTEFAFSFIAAAAWTASVFFVRTQELYLFSGVLLALYVLDYEVLTRGNGYSRWPRASLITSFIAYLGVIVFAALKVHDKVFLSTLFIYVGIAYVGSIIREMKERLGATQAFTYFWAVTFVVSISAVFGSSIYGHIKNGLGGGEPRKVVLHLADAAPISLKRAMCAFDSDGTPVTLIAETPSEIIVSTNNDTSRVLRIVKTSVAAIASSEVKAEWGASQLVQPTPDDAVGR